MPDEHGIGQQVEAVTTATSSTPPISDIVTLGDGSEAVFDLYAVTVI
ncbi:MAG: hypothetical protein ACFCVB_04710 [Nodosilinea sp.]